MLTHRTLEDLESAAALLAPSPTDAGPVEMIVARPATDVRETPDRGEMTANGGMRGDRWGDTAPDRSDAQITLINSRILDLVAGDRSRWPLAGDNLVVDLDLSRANLPAGTRLQAGTAVLEMTEEPHTGCSKFSARFGADALRFVNRGDGPEQRRRGAYARVVTNGVVTVGDVVRKLPPE